jgi:hypothetical protein
MMRFLMPNPDKKFTLVSHDNHRVARNAPAFQLSDSHVKQPAPIKRITSAFVQT